jgi:hypothetical protein
MRDTLPLGALCWAAAGKDPGFTPRSLLDLLHRRGRVRPADFARLRLTVAIDIGQLKEEWRGALAAAEAFVTSRPALEIGCLYYSTPLGKFVAPTPQDTTVVCHYGRPGGVLPQIVTLS